MNMKIALVHDCLREYGGAERVVEVLHELYPEAPLYTSFVDKNGLGRHADRFRNWNIKTSWLQWFPFLARFISPLRFLIPFVWKGFDFRGYDVVISSSGWFISRGITVQKPTIHICYIHHPPRNMYGYSTGSTLQQYRIVRVYAAILNFFLRHYDFYSAQAVDYFIANSKETARRVKKFYRRTSTVIYPPIVRSDVGKEKEKRTYYLSVGRLSWAKRIDLIIAACKKKNLPLKVVGVGKEEQYLRSMKGPHTEFLGSVSDEELGRLYNGAKALLFTALDEDFGMVPVEAMIHGTPVIALAQGGVKETVIDGKTGIVFDKPTVEHVLEAIDRFEKQSKNYDWTKQCKDQARKFDKSVFTKKMKKFVDRVS